MQEKEAEMYENISIQRFRGIENLTIDRLANINILIGKNGTGKSTVLEALWLHSNPTQSLVTRVDLFRPFVWEAPSPVRITPPWRHLFYGYRMQDPITISGEANGQKWTLRVRQGTESDIAASLQKELVALRTALSSGSFSEAVIDTGDKVAGSRSREALNPLNVGRPSLLLTEYQVDKGEEKVAGVTAMTGVTANFPASPTAPFVLAVLLTPASRYTDEAVVRFGRLDQENKVERVLKFVRILEPGLKRLAAIPLSVGGTSIHADIGQRELIPVQLMGGGFMSILAYAILTADLEGGLILIDEIENGVHYSALQALWKGLHELCSETGAQVVATTHSLECIEAARAALPGEAFLVHRLDRDTKSGRARAGGRVKVESLDADMLQSAVDMGLEVR